MFRSEKTQVVDIEGKLDACCVLPSPLPGAAAGSFNIVNDSGDLQSPAAASSSVDTVSRDSRKAASASEPKKRPSGSGDGGKGRCANLLRGSGASAVLKVLATAGSDPSPTTALIVADDTGSVSRRCLTTGESLGSSYKLEQPPQQHSSALATVLIGLSPSKEPSAVQTLYVIEKENQLVALDAETMQPKQVFTGADNGHDGAARCMAVSPANDVVITGHDCQRVVVWSVADGARQSAFTHNGDGGSPDAAVTSVEISPDGSLLVVGDAAGTATLYELAEQRELLTYDVVGNTGSAEAIDDGHGSDDAAAAVAVTHLLFSPTRYWLACATAAGSIIVYDLENRDIVVSTTHATFHSDDGEGGGGADAAVLSVWKNPSRRPRSGVRSMAFSADGLNLFAVRHDGSSTRISLDGEN